MTRNSGKRAKKSKPAKTAKGKPPETVESEENASAGTAVVEEQVAEAPAVETGTDEEVIGEPESAHDAPDPDSFPRGVSVEAEEATASEDTADEADEAALPGEDDDQGPGLENTRPQATGEAHLRSILESLIFVSDSPVTPQHLAKAARASLAQVKRILEELQAFYATRGIHLVEVSGGVQFRTPAANAPFVRDWVAAKPVRLTRAQLETLAIVAYRQPVTRPEIDEIRGVDSGSALKVLADRGLIKFLGRRDEAGRPLLYGTTPQFLEFFGLGGLKDLPTLREFSELSDESRALFERKMGEPLDLKSVAEETAAQDAERAARGDDHEGEEALEETSDGVEASEAASDVEAVEARASEPEANEDEATASHAEAESPSSNGSGAPAENDLLDETDEDEAMRATTRGADEETLP